MFPDHEPTSDESGNHISTLMPAFDYEELAPAELLRPPPQRVLDGCLSHLNLSYASPLGWRPLLLDVHLPEGAKGPYPAVVYVHGGSFLGGIKAMGPWQSLPAQGIAVVSVSYRLSGEAHFPDPVEDIRAAVRWTRRNAEAFNLDANAIALWGSSAGAYLASMAAVSGELPLSRPIGDDLDTPTHVSAVVNHYGISDFAKLSEDAFENTEHEKEELARIIRQFLGFDPMKDPERATQATPLQVARERKDSPPFLFMHGDADHRVGLGQSIRFHEGLLGLGRSSTLVTLAGAEHGDQVFSRRETVQQAITFLRASWADTSTRAPRD